MDIYHMTCPALLATIFVVVVVFFFFMRMEKLMPRTANFALSDGTSKSNLSAS